MGEEKGCRMMVMKRGKKCKEGREEKWMDGIEQGEWGGGGGGGDLVEFDVSGIYEELL